MASGDEFKKSTGDPIRDAIIASGQAKSAALENLRQLLTAKERELLDAELAAQDSWQNGPTEAEFNDEWFTPLDVLDVTHERLADDAEKWSMVQELQAGTIRAVARKAQVNPHALGAEHLVVILPDAWRRMDAMAESLFWKTRNLVVPAGRSDIYGHPTGDKQRYFDIKFDPESFTGKPLPHAPSSSPVDEASIGQSVAPPGGGNPGGRPRKDFWEDLLIEMFDQLWHGTLNPKTQSNIEDAMSDWLSANNKEASERAVRQRAQRLWKVWTKEGNN